MRHLTRLALLLLSAAPALALAQPAGDPNAPPPPYPDGATADGPPPPEGPPVEAPPPPPLQDSKPALAPEAAPQPAPGPSGQWVHTAQYGWLWIPYGQQYTYVPADPQVFPDQYVYYPVYGWRWVVAPWVYGYGPSPYWGASGPRYYLWYSRPWFRVGGYWGWGGYRGWGQYRGWAGPRAWGPRGWAKAPAYYRHGNGGPHQGHLHPAPAPARRGPEHERGREGRREDRREDRRERDHDRQKGEHRERDR